LLSQETSCKNSFLLSHDPVPFLSVPKIWFFGSFLHEFYEAFGGTPHNQTHHSLIFHRLPLHHRHFFFLNIFWGDISFFVLYSTLLYLPPLRFHCVGGCWDRTQDSCDYGIGCQTLLVTTRLDLIHIRLDRIYIRLEISSTTYCMYMITIAIKGHIHNIYIVHYSK